MEEVIKNFYTGLSERDAEKMVSYYHKDIVFEDPVFGKLEGEDAVKMWHWLCLNGKDLKIKFSDIRIDNDKGTAKWEARYSYGKRKRPIFNKVSAEFEFKDGKIIKHTDNFSLKNWATQAIGWKGKVIGGTEYFKKKLQFRSKKLLENFEIAENA
ncbi:nuclear transport factor 2 family protein [Aquimarina brevivitae]|uniref:Ketosteroid isomerase-like protein n=1 Tax=Aquimarina brevivitae TaxID=323412 RepID=A0A4Q7PH36_9FLAO|nr:nuclear transport factor 2 family protein [Aquimarina brevivitae]RZS99238.1 ketosteroid isomerase-like protein [Aquimarina brevivitae]